VEVKARFDEQANISWARKLEKAGVHVVYGLVGLKTHCKLTLIIRQEADGTLGHYSHVGTGNYNPKTSRVYEDYGLFTADKQVGEELTRLFNELSGYAIEKKYKRLLVAPRYLRKGLLTRIKNEIKNHSAGKPARIRLKLNSLVDEVIIDALYRASKAGVPIDIWVRGICTLIPGIPGLSENITVKSVLGRYLEHSRIFWFENSGSPSVFIGSADMMHRNLDRRIEVLVQITDTHHITQLGEQFDRGLNERMQSWVLTAEGSWERRIRDASGALFADVQNETMLAIPCPQTQRSERMSSQPQPVLAGGAVCWKVVDGKLRILLVHRTQHKDVSLPKGKADPGETLPETAQREILEETGLHITLGPYLGRVDYSLPGGKPKEVHYWAAEVDPGEAERSPFESNNEIFALEWLSLKKARKALTYEHDIDIVENFEALFESGRARTFPLILVRHGKAMPPENWDGPDSTRPLLHKGLLQARNIAGGVKPLGPQPFSALPQRVAWRRWVRSKKPPRCHSKLRKLSRKITSSLRGTKFTPSWRSESAKKLPPCCAPMAPSCPSWFPLPPR